MGRHRVRFTTRALGHFERVKEWWRENRPAAPDLFELELDSAVEALAETPEVGVPYSVPHGAATRRLLLPTARYHVYYDVDDRSHLVLIIAIWHASRGRRPPISREPR